MAAAIQSYGVKNPCNDCGGCGSGGGWTARPAVFVATGFTDCLGDLRDTRIYLADFGCTCMLLEFVRGFILNV